MVQKEVTFVATLNNFTRRHRYCLRGDSVHVTKLLKSRVRLGHFTARQTHALLRFSRIVGPPELSFREVRGLSMWYECRQLYIMTFIYSFVSFSVLQCATSLVCVCTALSVCLSACICVCVEANVRFCLFLRIVLSVHTNTCLSLSLAIAALMLISFSLSLSACI